MKECTGYLLYLKWKRCGQIKGRGCTDSQKQQEYIPCLDAASPTVAIKSVLITAAIDTAKGHKVAIADIPGAFLHMASNEDTHLCLTGYLVQILLSIDHNKYAPYVTLENGQAVIYVKLLKALYGTLHVAHLFWQNVTEQLISWGFNINPYDPQTFGKEAPLNISHGLVHQYLGMQLDFSTCGSVIINMKGYINSLLETIPPEMSGFATTPALNHLFNHHLDKDPTLKTSKSKLYTHITMQLLYLSQHARPDI